MNRFMYGFLAVLCILWVILPDPVPVVVDDILVAAVGAITAIIFFKEKEHPVS